MNVRMPYILLAALVLAPALAWGLPAAAETAAAPLCAQGPPPATGTVPGTTPEPQPAQTTCGPCILDPCAAVGVRCTFTGCGRNNECCLYDCFCDVTCITGGTPGNACPLVLPICPPPEPICPNGVAETGEECDGSDLRNETCITQGFDGGTLACNADCTFDTSGCVGCGDAVCEGPENCETCPADCDSRQTGKPSERFCCGNGIAESAEGTGCAVCDGNC